jgi:ACS family tartrate transporter-like MFS transporter
MHLRAGLQGWQWVFLLEGIPSVLVGFVVFYYLTDGPEQATWLTPRERSWLINHMNQEEQYRQQRHGADFVRALGDSRVWLLIAIYFTVAVGANASGAYFPKLIEQAFQDTSKFQIGLLSALPHVCAIVGMSVIGIHSDRTGERQGHVAFSAFLAAAGWTISALASSPGVALAGLCVAQTGMMGMLPTFWALPTAFLSGVAAAGGIALINSVGNIGGALGPWLFGKLGLPAMAAFLFTGGCLVLLVRHDSTLDRGLPYREAGS